MFVLPLFYQISIILQVYTDYCVFAKKARNGGTGLKMSSVKGGHGAGYEARTRDIQLGKLTLYQLS